MSLHRYAAARDKNEPTIRKRFAHHGWHTEQVSGAGMPDLVAFNLHSTFHPGVRLVDVKMPKGALKPAQVKKWAALRALGIPVYVVRTEADVDALVGGTLEPWSPEDRHLKPCVEAAKGCRCTGCVSIRKRGGTPTHDPSEAPTRVPRAAYTPPLSTPVDAAKEAEATFAPDKPTAHRNGCTWFVGGPCTRGCAS